MNRILVLAAVLGLCASAGSAPLRAQQPGPASPRVALERAKSAVAAKDWEGLWGLASQENQEDFIAELIKSKKKWRREDPAAKERLTGRTYGELLKMGWSRLFAEFVGAARAKDLSALDPGAWAFAGERIDGERAEVAFQGAGSPRTLRFAKEDGAWRLADAKILEGGERRGRANEASAVASLKTISIGQEQFKNAVCVDVDANGVGEYGLLAELGGSVPCRGGDRQYSQNPYVPGILGKVNAKGVAVKNGYCFVVHLPSGERSAAAADGAAVSAPLAETAFRAFAWPVEKGVTGDRAYFVDAQGTVHVRVSEWSGPDNPPPWDAGFDPGEGWDAGPTRDWVPLDQLADEGDGGPPSLPAGSVTFEAAKKVFTDYFSKVLECVRTKKEINGQEAMNAAARAGGFKDWADYATQAAQSLGPEQWKKLVDEVVRWYQKEMEKVTKEMTEEQGK